ncbi:hypothetical protein AA313_de0203671 [Arthrobotrys entomopaga]|nr:hypothetical protein AA313_de0203671 [Arthrobotrys entomopaga]
MYPYEKFMTTSFPILNGYVEEMISPLDDIDLARRLAIRFLTMKCSAKYGYPAEAHLPNDDPKSVYDIPTSYDSALLLPYLKIEGLCQEVLDALANVVLDSRRSNGNWNFFIQEADTTKDMFPDDVDDTGCALMALYSTGHLTLSQMEQHAQIMLDSVMRTKDGLISTWLVMGSDRKIQHERYL